jgi:hypothetical protein
MFEYCGTQLKPEIAFRPSDPRCFGLCAALYQPHCPDFILCFFFHRLKPAEAHQNQKPAEAQNQKRVGENVKNLRALSERMAPSSVHSFASWSVQCDRVFCQGRCFAIAKEGVFCQGLLLSHKLPKVFCVKQVCSSEDEIKSTTSTPTPSHQPSAVSQYARRFRP